MSHDHLPTGGRFLLAEPKAREPEKRARDAWNRGLDGVRGETPERFRYDF